MEENKKFAKNKLTITVGDVSFTEHEIMAQSDMNKIGSVVDMLVVEIDQQRYEEYLSSGLGDQIETLLYRCVIFKTSK